MTDKIHTIHFKDSVQYTAEELEEVGESLRRFGFLPGGYLCSCYECDKVFSGAKRSHRCLTCAEKAKHRAAKEDAVKIATGQALFVAEIPSDWYTDNVILYQRNHMHVTYDCTILNGFTVNLNMDGYEVYSGELAGCLEFIRRCEKEANQKDPENMEKIAAEVDTWLQSLE